MLAFCGTSQTLNRISCGKTDSIGGDPVLRRLKGDEVMRSASANRNTIKALEERGLIVPGKGRDLVKIVWRLRGNAKK